MTDDIGYMDKGLLLNSIIPQLNDDTVVIPFFRGESFVHPDCWLILTWLNDGPLKLAIHVNMLRPKIAKFLSGLNNLSLSISFGDMSNVDIDYKALDYLVKNVEDLQFSYIDNGEYNPMYDTPPPQRLIEILKRYKEAVRVRVYEEHSFGGKLGWHPHNRNHYPCPKPFEETVILWDGTVASCNHDWNHVHGLGNVNNFSIGEIWNDEPYKQLRLQHLGKRPMNDLCKHCSGGSP